MTYTAKIAIPAAPKPESKWSKDLRAKMQADLDARVEKIISIKPTWQEVLGGMVLRIGDSDFIAAPCTEGRKNSAKFDIINFAKGEYICQLNRSEVNGWLVRQEIN